MGSRIVLVIVSILCTAMITGMAMDMYNPYGTAIITFVFFIWLSFSLLNYLENGIFWFWGSDRETRLRKAREKRLKQ